MLPFLIRLKKDVPLWHHPSWRDGRLKPSAGAFVAPLIGAIASGGIGLVGLLKEGLFGAPWDALDAVLLAFIGASLLMTVIVVRKGHHLLRYHGSEFVMHGVPGIIGGKLTGTLHLHGRLPDGAEPVIELVNLKQSPMGSRHGGDATGGTIVEREWQSRIQLPRERMGGTAQSRFIPIEFTVPYGTKDMTDRYYDKWSRRYVNFMWMLYVYLEPHATEPQLEFSVPVFRTPQSDPSVVDHVAVPKDGGSLADAIHREGHAPRVRVLSDSPVLRYAVSAWPGWGQFLPPLIMTTLLNGGAFLLSSVLWSQASTGMRWDGEFLELAENVATLTAFGMFAVLLCLMGAGTLFWLVQATTARVSWVAADGVILRRSFLGLDYEKHIPFGRIKNLSVENSGMTSGKKFKRVKLNYRSKHRRKNRHLYLADYIYSRTEAKWLARTLSRAVFAGRKKVGPRH